MFCDNEQPQNGSKRKHDFEEIPEPCYKQNKQKTPRLIMIKTTRKTQKRKPMDTCIVYVTLQKQQNT